MDTELSTKSHSLNPQAYDELRKFCNRQKSKFYEFEYVSSPGIIANANATI